MSSKIEENFLVTKDDYVEMSLDKKRFFTPKENKIIMRVLGAIAVWVGVMALFTSHNGIYYTVCWLLMILMGLYVVCYYDIIDPVYIRKQAAAFYEYHSRNLKSAFTLTVTDDTLTLRSETHTVSVPQKYIYKIAEGKKTILIFVDKEQFYFVPARVLNEQQLRQLTVFADQKYMKL